MTTTCAKGGGVSKGAQLTGAKVRAKGGVGDLEGARGEGASGRERLEGAWRRRRASAGAIRVGKLIGATTDRSLVCKLESVDEQIEQGAHEAGGVAADDGNALVDDRLDEDMGLGGGRSLEQLDGAQQRGTNDHLLGVGRRELDGVAVRLDAIELPEVGDNQREDMRACLTLVHLLAECAEGRELCLAVEAPALCACVEEGFDRRARHVIGEDEGLKGCAQVMPHRARKRLQHPGALVLVVELVAQGRVEVLVEFRGGTLQQHDAVTWRHAGGSNAGR